MNGTEPTARMAGPSDSVVESFADLADRVRATPARLGPVRLVAVDGPSGAGKTTFAGHLARSLGGVPVVHTDDLLDGWDDELTFWPRLQRLVLDPLRRGEPADYPRYDWDRRCFGPGRVTVPPAPVVVLEGVTAARAALRPELSLSVFVTAPDDLRLRRALARDGVALRPYLERWRIVERAHFSADATARRVDLVVDGAPGVPHDPATQYVRLPGGVEAP